MHNTNRIPVYIFRDNRLNTTNYLSKINKIYCVQSNVESNSNIKKLYHQLIIKYLPNNVFTSSCESN